MTEDEEIVFRFIEYGFGHAFKNRTFISGGERMVFPRPCILYLDEGKKDTIPDEYTLIMEFENQGEFTYKVPVLKLQNFSVEELNEKKLIALLPFQLLKLRKKIQNIRTDENLKELQDFVMNDIIETIRKNEDVRNISHNDAHNLIELTMKLYMKIFSKYKELEEFTVRLYDQSMELATDKYEKTVDELEEENNQLKADILALKNELNSTKDIISNLQAKLSSMQK